MKLDNQEKQIRSIQTLEKSRDRMKAQGNTHGAADLENKLLALRAGQELGQRAISELKPILVKYDEYLEHERKRITGILDEIDRIIWDSEEWRETRAQSRYDRECQVLYDEDYMFHGGEQLGNRFKVLCPIDQGKFGQVVKCADIRDKKKIYAAKISKNMEIGRAHV